MQLSRLGTIGILAAFALAIALGVFLQDSTSDQVSAAGEAMAIDCDASTGGIDTNCTYDEGDTFTISVHTTNAGDGYGGYQVKPRWTDAILDYLPNPEENPDTTSENQWPSCFLPARVDNQPGDPSVLFACASFSVTSTYTGVLVVFEMSCEAEGTTDLTLVPRQGDDQGGTHFADVTGFIFIIPALTNANVTCVDATPSNGDPTDTPTPTNTPTSCVVRVTPAAQALTVGQSSGFDVEVSQCLDVAGVSFLLNYDETIINVDSGPGTPDFPTGCGVSVGSIDNGSGVLDFACITAPLTGYGGGGVVAHYEATCLSAGVSPLTLKTIELVTSSVGLIPHSVQGGSFECLGSTATPGGPTPTPTATPDGPTPTPTNTPGGPTPTPTNTPADIPTTNTPTPTSQLTPSSTSTPTSTPSGQPGDVNCNGRVDAIDAALVLQFVAAFLDVLSCQELADLNEDGVIDARDALFILWIAAGLV